MNSCNNKRRWSQMTRMIFNTKTIIILRKKSKVKWIQRGRSSTFKKNVFNAHMNKYVCLFDGISAIVYIVTFGFNIKPWGERLSKGYSNYQSLFQDPWGHFSALILSTFTQMKRNCYCCRVLWAWQTEWA